MAAPIIHLCAHLGWVKKQRRHQETQHRHTHTHTCLGSRQHHYHCNWFWLTHAHTRADRRPRFGGLLRSPFAVFLRFSSLFGHRDWGAAAIKVAAKTGRSLQRFSAGPPFHFSPANRAASLVFTTKKTKTKTGWPNTFPFPFREAFLLDYRTFIARKTLRFSCIYYVLFCLHYFVVILAILSALVCFY